MPRSPEGLEEQRIAHKKWLREHPEEKSVYAHDDYEKHRTQRLEYVQGRWNKQKQQCFEVFGSKCEICHSETHLQFHEKNGNSHPKGYMKYSYILKHQGDFILLCVLCHTGVHFLMEKLGMSGDDVLQLIRARAL